MFSAQARYEEGDVALDEPLNRVAVIAEVRALLDRAAVAISQFDGVVL
ncbi:MAG: hypothetical protein Q8Q28_18210 [Pseudomonadota bacterium]|nr:hypothetical protein [Pseudomonadota bacterium]